MKRPSRQLQLEHLQDRIVPAINFSTSTLVGGLLTLRTTATNTDVTITWTSPDDVDVTDNTVAVTVSYQNVTRLTYLNSFPTLSSDDILVDTAGFAVPAGHTFFTGDLADVVDIQTNGGSIGALNVQLRGGNDGLYLNTVAAGDVTGDVVVNTGAGADDFYLDDTSITGSLNLTNPSGYDDIYFDDLTLTGRLTATLGNDGGDFYIDGLVTGGDVTITAGGGGHNIAIDNGSAIAQSTIGGNLTMISGAGNDGLYLDDTTVSGNLLFSSGAGNDTLYIEYSVAVTGSVTLNAGAGDDDVTIDDDVSIGGSLNVDLGDGADDFDINELITIGGNLSVNGGAGNDDIDISDAIITGILTINAGEGTNFIRIERSFGDGGTTVGGTALISGGTGADTLTINTTGEGFTVGGGLFLNLGAGANFWDVDQDFSVAGNLSITSGAGDDLLTLFASTAGTVGGSLTMNLGDGANTFTFRGSVGSGGVGGLTYVGGAGVDLVMIDGFVAKQLGVQLGAGDDTFSYGALFATTDPAVFSGFVDGGAGTDTYDGSLLSAAIRTLINARTTRTQIEVVIL